MKKFLKNFLHMTDFRRMKNANYMFCTEVRKTQMVHGISQRQRFLIYLLIMCLQKMWLVVVKHHGQRLEVKSMK